ncbi:thioredoxin family protein [Flammeovirga sp. EKP202]|uniref:thioredoxin family protein n=1 Tax=Flammeovirga sp. EKP202 TaxID=2770592 RepID=UPI00165FD749|nr:thioredoxin family protein [Flammeovirga sp. EKP202]MBD0403951.1 thioredoxin family protein [Flammeovirga sp. EKP202]
MKKTILTLIISVIALTTNAQGINFFEGSWEQAKAEAKRTNKLIFVDAYTTWCGPCKMLKRDVFPKKEVGDLYNENFISVALDMESSRGMDFKNEFTITSYPTLMYFLPDGKLVYRKSGAPNLKRFIDQSKKVVNLSEEIITLKSELKKTNYSKELLTKYVSLVYKGNSSDEEMLNLWFSKLDESDFKEKNVLGAIGHVASQQSITSKYVLMFSNLEDYYLQSHSVNEVDKIYNSIVSNTLYPLFRRGSTSDWEAQKSVIEKMLGKDKAEYYYLSLDVQYYLSRENWKTASYSADKFIALCEVKNKRKVFIELNKFAWSFYRADVSKKYLNKALLWANRSVELQEQAFNLDTQANILYKLKMYEEAKVAAEKSIELAKSRGRNPTGTQKLLDKITKSI